MTMTAVNMFSERRCDWIRSEFGDFFKSTPLVFHLFIAVALPHGMPPPHMYTELTPTEVQKLSV